jgi:squalene-hopene/tetraprenyl-beta-curcumene cyclase
MHFLGRTGEPKVRKAANFLREKMLPEGGWAIYPGGPPDVSSTAKGYFVLKLQGDDPRASHMRRCRELILDLGGLDACNSFTKIYLAIFGQYSWRKCPSVPPELVLFPRWFYLNIYAMSSWSRAILVPLSVISAKKPTCRVPQSASIRDLVTGRRTVTPSSPWGALFYALDVAVKAGEKLPVSILRRAALAQAERWILSRLEGSHGLGAIFPPIINTILALNALGYSLDDPIIQGQVRELERLEIEEEDTLRVQPCFSAVWDTAYAVYSLVESGLAEDHPAVVRGGRWMLDRRGHDHGDWTAGRTPAPAGWYFEYANPYYPDCDTTSQVITALSRVTLPAGEDRATCQRAIFEAHEWHLGMQNRDGGWGAFDRGCDREVLTKVPFADHNAMIDPSTADLTARGLEAMAELGFDRGYPPARAAIQFLRRTQEPDGSWYGRWGCNYIYGTGLVLWSLRKIREPHSAPWIRRAAAWLKSCQQRDGGWGETPASYEDPLQKGMGPSTPSQTAWALMGLLSTGDRESASVRRGIDFLLERQGPDGDWPEEEWTGTGFPRVFYLRYHLYPLYFPILALGAYAHGASPHEKRVRARVRTALRIVGAQETAR